MKKINEISSKVIKWLIKNLRKLENNITNESKNQYGYEALSPKDDIGDRYFRELDIAIKNKDVKNIALGGPYGAGKSSIIKTYIKNREEYKFLTISLANFEDVKDPESQTKKIEEHILKQIFYSVKSKKLPYSRYKKINNIKRTELLATMLVFTLAIMSYTIIFNPQFIINMREKIDIFKSLNIDKIGILKPLNIKNKQIIIISGIIFSVAAGGLLIKLIEFIKQNLKLTKLSTTNVEISKDNNEQYIFNKNIDELLYFFEVNKYDIVVFEDIDRFDNVEIFVKLRELNDLINNYEQIKRKVTFIYALKEDMFKDAKKRTKFFDFIISIIPYINSSNSIDILNNKFKDNNLEKDLSNEFISDITIYIDDMRILNNIYNEFVMYKEYLKDIKLNMNNLFGMIVYKNIYPEDFSKLQFNEGMVGEVFENKEYIQKIIKDIDDEYIKIESDIKKVNDIWINDIDELKSIYLERLNIDKSKHILMDNANYDYNSFKLDILTDLKYIDERIQYYSPGDGHRYVNIRNILNCNGTKESYHERKRVLNLRKEEELEKLKVKLSELKSNKQKVKSLKVKELIEIYGIKNIISEETRKEKLIVYLIRHGYIDEMYNSYLTYFHEGSLSKDDMKFVQSVKNQEQLPFNYNLSNIVKVMDRLFLSEFKRPEVLNYKLLNFIISNMGKYELEYKYILEQLANEGFTGIEFVDGYLEVVEYKNIFINTLCKEWTSIWKYIINKSNYPKDKIDEYLLMFIELLDIEDLININKDNLLSEYISTKEDFLKMSRALFNNDKVKKLLEELEISFEFININEVEDELIDFVYKNNLYEINYKMVKLIIEKYSNNTELDKLETCNYTTIKESECENLTEYIELNIGIYIEDVFFKLDNNSDESEKYLVELLNKEAILNENKFKIIDKQSVLISNISEIDEDLWTYLFKKNKVVLDWFNLSSYLSSDKLDEDVILEFLNDRESYTKLQNQTINKEIYNIDEEDTKNLCRYLFIRKDISNDSFEKLVLKIKELCNIYINEGYFDEFIESNVSVLEEDKINILIDLNLIKLTKETYEFIREKLNPKYIKLIENNIDKYMQEYQIYDLNSQDISILIKSSILSDEEKEFIIDNVNIEDILNDGIYDKLENELASYLVRINKEVEISLLNYMLKSNINKYDKVAILSNKIKELNSDNISRALKMIGDEYEYIVEKGRIPFLKDNDANRRLVKVLEEKEYISSSNIQANEIKINKRRKAISQ